MAGAAWGGAAGVARVGVGAWAGWGAVALVRGRVLLLGVAVGGVRAVVAVVRGGLLLVRVVALLGEWRLLLVVLVLLLVGVVLVLEMRVSK